MPTIPIPQECRQRAEALILAREVQAITECIEKEAQQANCTRAYLESYASRLLKAAARLYAATLPAPAEAQTQRSPTIVEAALLATFNGERHAA